MDRGASGGAHGEGSARLPGGMATPRTGARPQSADGRATCEDPRRDVELRVPSTRWSRGGRSTVPPRGGRTRIVDRALSGRQHRRVGRERVSRDADTGRLGGTARRRGSTRHEALRSMTDDFFPRDTEGLTEVVATRTLRLRDGDHIDLRISPVTKHLGGDVLRMLAYDGSIPGPMLHVDQGSELTVHVKNDGDLETTVHWHGLRLENQYDGVPFETQSPIPIGGSYTQKITFPDAGFYWYHPHIREDYGLELGLYGTIVVEPADPSYWPPTDRYVTLTLDDLLVEDGKVAPFSRSGPTFVAMGRYGNVMLINGQTQFSGQAAAGEVVRLYVVNTANTRIFNFAIRGARAKLVGGDSGRYERETIIDEVLLAPSERAVLDALSDSPGQVQLEHRTPG